MKTFLLISLFIPYLTFANGWGHLSLKGKASYHWFLFHIYDAKLWSNTSNNSMFQSPLVLELEYKRNLSGKDIIKQTKKEIIHAGHHQSKVSAWIKTIKNIFPDVIDGDRITAKYHPQKGVSLFFNRTKLIGTIKDRVFSKAFLNIWIGESSSDKNFRNKLLGEK